MTDTINYSDSKKLLNDLEEIRAEGVRLSELIEVTIPNLRTEIKDAAQKEFDYRQQKSGKFVEARTKDEFSQAKDRESWVDAETAQKRMERDIAEGLKDATKEEIRNLRQQLSFVQTLLNGYKTDQDFHRFGQNTDVAEPDMPPFEDHA